MKHVIAMIKGDTEAPRLYVVPDSFDIEVVRAISSDLMLEMLTLVELKPEVMTKEHEVVRALHLECIAVRGPRR